jgi:hypothetical protein
MDAWRSKYVSGVGGMPAGGCQRCLRLFAAPWSGLRSLQVQEKIGAVDAWRTEEH